MYSINMNSNTAYHEICRKKHMSLMFTFFQFSLKFDIDFNLMKTKFAFYYLPKARCFNDQLLYHARETVVLFHFHSVNLIH